MAYYCYIFIFFFQVIGVPQPTLKWFKDGRELKAGDIHKIISGEDGSCCLGMYTCEAHNCMGTTSSSAALLGFEGKICCEGNFILKIQWLSLFYHGFFVMMSFSKIRFRNKVSFMVFKFKQDYRVARAYYNKFDQSLPPALSQYYYQSTNKMKFYTTPFLSQPFDWINWNTYLQFQINLK